MSENARRLLTLLTVVAMVFSMMPLGVSAQSMTEEEQPVTQELLKPITGSASNVETELPTVSVAYDEVTVKQGNLDGAFDYVLQNGQAIITYCYLEDTVLQIPAMIEGYPVVGITSLGRISNYVEELTIPDSVTMLSEDFLDTWGYDIPLKKLTLGIGVSFFDMEMVRYATALESIEVPSMNGYLESIDGVLYNQEVTELLAYPPAKTDLHVMPNTVTDASVLFDSWYVGLFGNINVQLSESLTDYKVVDGFVFSADMSTLLKVAPSATGSYVIPDSVVKIEEFAFAGSNLTSVTVGAGVTEITYNAFSGATQLEEIVIPSTVKEIANAGFDSCSNLNKVSISDINAWCNIDFMENPLSKANNLYLNGELVVDLVIPAAADGQNSDRINACAFEGGSFRSVTIPTRIKYIGYDAFAYCYDLIDVYISDLDAWCGIQFDGVGANPLSSAVSLYLNGEEVTDLSALTKAETIGDYAFYSAYMPKVTIPAFVTYIGAEAFGSAFLKEITFEEGSLTSIGREAFRYTDLETVTLPKSLKTVNYKAFADCEQLKEVVFNCESVEIYSFAFANCPLGDLDFGENVTYIGEYAFNNVNASQIKIPESVTTLSYRAFAFNDSLVSVTIPASVTKIDNSFDGDKNLSHVLYTGTEDQRWEMEIRGDQLRMADWHYEAKGDEVTTSQDCNSITMHCSICNKTETYYKNIGDHVKDENGKCTICGHVGDWEYRIEDSGNVTVFGYSGNADDVVVPATIQGKSVTAIAPTLFAGRNDIWSVVLPDSITEIPARAFSDCRWLYSVTLGNKVTTIGEEAFYCCYTLREVNMPDTVTYIGDFAFAKSGISEVELSAGVKEISFGLFQGCGNLWDVTIPDTVTTIGYYAFEDTYIGDLVIPASVKKIGPGAFSYVSRAIFQGDQPRMYSAFGSCYGMNAYYSADNASWSVVPDDNNNWYACQMPEIYEQPQTAVVQAGEIATVQLSASGEYLQYRWYYAAPGAKRFELYSEDYAFIMEATPETLGGRVYCLVTDLLGRTVRSETVYLKLPSEATGIRLSRLPYTVEYDLNQTLRTRGLEVMLTYADGTEEKISDYTVSGYDRKTAGQQTITVAYGDYTATFTVTVNADSQVLGRYGNEKAEVSAPNGAVPENTWVVTEKVYLEYMFDELPEILQNREYKAVDISLETEGMGTTPIQQPVEVSIPVPGHMEGKRCKVYHIGWDSVATDMNAVYEDGHMVFTTDHFSYYAIVEMEGVTVSGTIKGRGDLTGTQVNLLSGNEILATAIVSANGKYQFTNVIANDYVIEVVQDGTAPKRVALTVTENDTTQDIRMATPGDVDGNEAVTRDDVIRLLLHVTMPGQFPVDAEVDFNGDGAVTRDDVIKLLLHVTMPNAFPLVG